MKIDDLHLIFSWGHKNFVLKTPVNAELSSSPSPPPSPSPSPLLEVLSSQLSWPTWLLSIVGTDRGGMVSSSSSSPSWSNQLDFWALLEQIEEGWWASRWHSLSDELAPVLIPVKWLLRQKYILRGGVWSNVKYEQEYFAFVNPWNKYQDKGTFQKGEYKMYNKNILPRLPKLATLLLAATCLAQPEIKEEKGPEWPRGSGGEGEKQKTFTEWWFSLLQSAPHSVSWSKLCQSFEISKTAVEIERACQNCYTSWCLNESKQRRLGTWVHFDTR